MDVGDHSDMSVCSENFSHEGENKPINCIECLNYPIMYMATNSEVTMHV